MYEGKVAKVDSLSELVWRHSGAVDGLHSLVDVAQGLVGSACGDVFEEVEERFAHPFVRVHQGRDKFLVHRCCRDLVLVVLLNLACQCWGHRWVPRGPGVVTVGL